MSKSIFFIFIFTNLTFVNLAQNSINSKIIAFGEASHGDAIVYQRRIEFINNLKKNSKEKINVLIEMPHGATFAIRDYRKNLIDSTKLISKLENFGLQTNSFLKLINTYKNDDQINFLGIDMTSHLTTVEYLKNVFPTKQDTVLSNLFDNFNKSLFEAFKISKDKDSLLLVYNENYKKLKTHIGNNSYYKETNHFLKNEIDLGLQIINQTVHYFYYYDSDPIKESLYRDSCMAANSAQFINNLNGKFLIFAANYHVSKLPKTCGWYLDMIYGEQYFVIAHQFYTGEVLTVRFINGKRNFVCERYISKNKTLPSKLYKIGEKGYIDFKQVKNKKIMKLISKKVLIQDFGGFYDANDLKNNYVLGIPNIIYDALFFDILTTASLHY